MTYPLSSFKPSSACTSLITDSPSTGLSKSRKLMGVPAGLEVLQEITLLPFTNTNPSVGAPSSFVYSEARMPRHLLRNEVRLSLVCTVKD